jgi:hypothetical protein
MDWFTPEMLAGVAFPSAVCIYLLVRVEGTLKELGKNVSYNNTLTRAVLIKMGADVDSLKDAV